jgi:hypothetical protein
MNKGLFASAAWVAVVVLPLTVTAAIAADKKYDPGASDN